MRSEESAQKLLHQLLLLAVIAGLVSYFAFLIKWNCFFAAGPDSSGYANEAKLLASGHMIKDVPLMREWKLDKDLIYIFTPLGFVRGRDYATMAPSYPAGVPLHQVLFAKIGGWKRAPFLVSPVLATGCLVLMIAAAGELGLPLVYGALCAAILGAVPVFMFHAVQPVSDVVATFWALTAILLAMKATRHGWTVAAAAGVAFAIGVWVRPTNFLLALPLAFAMRWRIRGLIVAAAAALPIGIALGWYNYTLYGHPLRTGYGSFIDVVSWKALGTCLPFHTRGLYEMLTPMVMPMALLIAFDDSTERWRRTVLLVWFASFFCFYIFYGVCDGWPSYRFLLPALPPLILAFAVLFRRAVAIVAASTSLRFARIVAVLVALSIVGMQVRTARRLDAYKQKRIDEVYPGTIAWAEPQLPKDAIVLSGLMSGPFLYYADRQTIRFDQMNEGTRIPVLRAAAKRAGKRWYAVLSNEESGPEKYDAWLPARWIPVAMYRDVTLWRLDE